jgi:hypothetical protein
MNQQGTMEEMENRGNDVFYAFSAGNVINTSEVP